ncbi:MAG: hypothetical protein D6714_14935, partial [Bacteroidetes bacterium]
MLFSERVSHKKTRHLRLPGIAKTPDCALFFERNRRTQNHQSNAREDAERNRKRVSFSPKKIMV